MPGAPGGRNIGANAFLSVSVPLFALSLEGCSQLCPLCYVLSPPLSPSFLNLLNS
jgi:hypothetical protein